MDYVRLARRAFDCGDRHRPTPGAAVDRRLPVSGAATKATEATNVAAHTEAAAYLVASRILGEEVWVVADQAHADELARELATEGDRPLIFTVDELLAMKGMIEADMRSIACVKRLFPGSCLDRVVFRTDAEVIL